MDFAGVVQNRLIPQQFALEPDQSENSTEPSEPLWTLGPGRSLRATIDATVTTIRFGITESVFRSHEWRHGEPAQLIRHTLESARNDEYANSSVQHFDRLTFVVYVIHRLRNVHT